MARGALPSRRAGRSTPAATPATVLVAGVLVASVLAAVTVAVAGTAPAAGPAGDARRARAEAGAKVSLRPVPRQGRVLWVAANGNDSGRGRGTEASPLRTVRRALSLADAGTTVVVFGRHPGGGDGVYGDQSWGELGAAHVTIQAYPGEQPRFTGSRALPTSPGAWRNDRLGWYVDVRHDPAGAWGDNPFPIPDQVAPDHPLADDPHQLFVGDSEESTEPLRQVRPPAADDDPLTAGTFSWELLGGGAGVRIRVGADPTGRSVQWSTRQQAVEVAPAGHGARIVGIAFTRYAPFHGDTLGAVRILADDVGLTDVSVTHSAATAIAASGENGDLRHPLRRLLLRRVTASDNGALGAAIGDASGPGADDARPNDVTVEWSRFERDNAEHFDVADCGDGRSCVVAGLKFARLNGLTVRWSVIAGNDGTGLWCDLYCDRVSIVGNHVDGNALSGVFVEVSRRVTVEANVITANGAAAARTDPDRAPGGVKVTGSSAVVVEGNSIGGGAAALVVGADDRSDPAAPAWFQQGDGAPQVTLRGNTMVAGPIANGGSHGSSRPGLRDVVATVGSDRHWRRWVTDAGGNRYRTRA